MSSTSDPTLDGSFPSLLAHRIMQTNWMLRGADLGYLESFRRMKSGLGFNEIAAGCYQLSAQDGWKRKWKIKKKQV